MTNGGNPTYLEDRECCWPRCGRRIPDNAPVPVCREHGVKIAREYQDVLYSEDRDRRERAVERYQRKRGNREGSLVYYIRIGNYIKIGYTERLRQRLADLRVDTDDVLAIEPGGRELEAQRHGEFVAERIHPRRENFHPSERLLLHIGDLRLAHEFPRWLTLPDTQTLRIRGTA